LQGHSQHAGELDVGDGEDVSRPEIEECGHGHPC
jgi:hypothetical protein